MTDLSPVPATPQNVTPSLIVVGGIDWRFTDPSADALMGFNFGKLSASPAARGLIAQLTSNQGLPEAETQKIFDALCGVDHVVLSVRDNQIVMLVTGRQTDSILPALDAGWKSAPVVGSAILVGNSEAVDQALQRISTEATPGALTRLAEEWQSTSEFWAVGLAGLAGPQAVSAGLKRFSLSVSMLDRLVSELAFEFSGVPDANTLRLLPIAPDSSVIDGHVVHAMQSFDQIAASPLGQRLAPMVKAARYLPVRDTSGKARSKPVIYGLDSGPKEVNQNPNN
ncbi:MAG TPA: hypothetical protein VEU96_29370 [Bryobacteraceae bacterium]|nr:hypothetical protein [Bryobacteraceae bacterium]